jgi:Xaa-Pro aminopeptidase
MVMSDEPAVYVEGQYGIRTENTILCHSWQENQWGDFLQFETLTLVPVDKAGIDKTLLGRECILWLNDYHRRVRAKLSPFLTEEESAWLAVKTSDLD